MTAKAGPDGRRAQDVGRPHRRRGRPAPETLRLLDRYREAMRAELAELLGSLEPAPSSQTTLDGTPAAPKRPALDTRSRTWDLAIKLARELGAAIEDTGPSDDELEAAGERVTRRRRVVVDYGGA